MFSLFSFLKKNIYPYNTGFLPEIDGHKIFFYEIGNPQGEIILSFHGGPGGRSNPQRADIFDLSKYRIIMSHQRGCGLTQSENPLNKNTLQNTINDALRLLDFLNIKTKISLHGCSFGSACALLFAEQNPNLVKKIFLISVFLGNTSDTNLFDEVINLFYPDAYDTFKSQAKSINYINYYYDLICSKNIDDNKKSMQYFGAIEHQLGKTFCNFPEISDDEFQKKINSFKVFMHYAQNNMFLTKDELIQQSTTIKKIPLYMFHNRLDMVCPVVNAYKLHKKMTNSKLFIIEDYGHISSKLLEKAKIEILSC